LSKTWERGEGGLLDLPGGPAADVTAAIEEHLEEADDARAVDLDAWIAYRADGDRQGEALQRVNADLVLEPRSLVDDVAQWLAIQERTAVVDHDLVAPIVQIRPVPRHMRRQQHVRHRP
jgi:hypothetical protein